MAIFTELAITVSGDKASLSSPVYLYLGDGDFTLAVSISKVNAKFGTWNATENLVKEFDTAWARMCILKPIPVDAPEGTAPLVVYTDKCEVRDDILLFEIDNELINEITEIGIYAVQIHLYDRLEGGNRLTIPPISFEVLQPICEYSHDVSNPNLTAIVGSAQVDRAFVVYSNDLETFREDGIYNITRKWVTGDVINAEDMNKIEDGIFWNSYYDNLVVDTKDKLGDITIDYISDGKMCYVREENEYYYYTEKTGWESIGLRTFATKEELNRLEEETTKNVTVKDYTSMIEVGVEACQYISLQENNTTITLPSITNGKMYEIHLYISVPSTLDSPSINFSNKIKWQEKPALLPETVFEFIFTWLPQENAWLGGFIVYEDII